MRQVNLIFLILLCCKKSHLEMRLGQVAESSVLPDFMIRILRSHFGSSRKTTILSSDRYLDLTDLIRGIDVPVVVNGAEVPLLQGLDTREPSELVVLIEDPVKLGTCLEKVLWTSDTRFIVIPTGPKAAEKTLGKIFQVFQAANIVSVFIFVTSLEKMSVFTYKPFVSKKCDSFEIVVLDAESPHFALSNRVDDLNGCLLNISSVNRPPMAIFPDGRSLSGTFHLEGTEAGIVKEVAEKLNFRTRFAIPKDGEAWGLIRPSPHGVVGEVFLKQSHFGFGLLTATLDRYNLLDVTVPVSPVHECVTWVVPLGAAKAKAVWIEIYFSEFSFNVSCCIVFFFFLVSLTFWKISKIYKSGYCAEVVLFLFSVFINVPVKSPKHETLKLLFLAWILYSFILIIFYQSNMGSKLTVPYPHPDIETINDLLESDLHLAGFSHIYKVVTAGAGGNLKRVASRVEPTTYGINEAVNHILFDRNIAYLAETTFFKYFTMKNPRTRGKVHFMKECIYQYYPVMVLQRRSPLTRRTNDIITRLFESGLLMNWRRRYIYSIPQSPPSAVQLTLKHMLAPFVAFASGILLSLITFIYELLRCNLLRGCERFRKRSSKALKKV